ncbi:MAG: hypothetical protein CMJ57_06890, partial [Planctomycetaceae bacterium]|nr:hypothetical protein [Planctomycetaceae bacterium]
TAKAAAPREVLEAAELEPAPTPRRAPAGERFPELPAGRAGHARGRVRGGVVPSNQNSFTGKHSLTRLQRLVKGIAPGSLAFRSLQGHSVGALGAQNQKVT